MTDTQTPTTAGDGESGPRNRLAFCVLLGLQAGIYGWAALFFRAKDIYMALGLAAVAALFAAGAVYMLVRASLQLVALIRKPEVAPVMAEVGETVNDPANRL